MALAVWRTGAWKLEIVKRSRDFKRYATTVAAFVRLAMIRIMLRHLPQTPRQGSELPGWALKEAQARNLYTLEKISVTE